MRNQNAIVRGMLTVAAATGLVLAGATPAQAHTDGKLTLGGRCIGVYTADHREVRIEDKAANNLGCRVDWHFDGGPQGYVTDTNGAQRGYGYARPSYSLLRAWWQVCEIGSNCTGYDKIL